MDDSDPKRSLADDPSFLASLSDLDKGLTDEKGKREPPSPRRESPRDVSAGDHTPSTIAASIGRRPLLELFPPPPPRQRSHKEAPSFADVAPPPAFADIAPPAPRAPSAQPHDETLPADTPETFYGLSEKPFSLSTDPKFLFYGASHERAAQTLLSAIRRREGIVLLTGHLGAGKTTLCRAVMDQLDRRTLTSFLFDPPEAIEGFLQTVLVDFGVISRQDIAACRLAQASRAELSATLRDFLFSLAPLQAFAVVIVDEAHKLSPDVLEQMRAVADLEGDQRLLQVVLVGQPELVTTLRTPALKELDQHISVRCTLEPLAASEVAGYVKHRLTTAGSDPRVEFDEAALAYLHQLSWGVPRVVNLLCDRALTIGYAASASVIDWAAIDAAAAELDVGVPESRLSVVLRRAAAAAVLLAMTLVGAAAAAIVFRDQFARLMAKW